jgi:beta-glucosidase
MTLLYAKGAEILGADRSGFDQAVGLARRADVVILALGEKADRTGEAASRAHLDLDGEQQRLLEAVHAAGKPVVLVLFSGRPLTIGWAAEHAAAIVAAWFPGVEAGPALVRMLFGDVSPSGRLTASWPRAVGQEPLYYNSLRTGRPMQSPAGTAAAYRFTSRYIDEENAPLYPFGYGRSYTGFTYSATSAAVPTGKVSAAAFNRGGPPALRATPAAAPGTGGSGGAAEGGPSVRVEASVTNSGDRDATEVVQCYIHLGGTSVARPVRELVGFERVHLAPRETRRVAFTLTWRELSFWDLEMRRRVEPATLDIWIGPDSNQGIPTRVLIEP